MPLPITVYAAHLRAEREAFNRQLEAEGFAPRPIPAARPARLLLLGCSATKSPAAGKLPARERYRGPLWLTLGAADPRGELAQVIAVSAAFGFVTEWQAIPDYEARLSRQAGEELAARIAAPAGVAFARGAAAESALAAIHDAAVKAERPLEEIALCGGIAYQAPMRAAVAAGIARGWIAPGARVVEIRDTIGRMRQALRAWLQGRELEASAEAPAEAPAATVTGDATPPVTPAEEDPPHLAGLRQALAAVERQSLALTEGAELKANMALAAWRRAQPDGSRRYSPSAMLASGAKRREHDARRAEIREAFADRRAGQLAHLAAKAARIRKAIAEAEERLRRRLEEEAARRRHNGGPALEAEAAARPAEDLRAPSPRPAPPAPLPPFLARPRPVSRVTTPQAVTPPRRPRRIRAAGLELEAIGGGWWQAREAPIGELELRHPRHGRAAYRLRLATGAEDAGELSARTMEEAAAALVRLARRHLEPAKDPGEACRRVRFGDWLAAFIRDARKAGALHLERQAWGEVWRPSRPFLADPTGRLEALELALERFRTRHPPPSPIGQPGAGIRPAGQQ